MSSDPHAVVPERALVFKLKSRVIDFESAAKAAGLEWLLEDQYLPSSDTEDDLDDDEDEDSQPGEDSYLYLTMPSDRGIDRLLALWNEYKKDRKPSREEKAWWGVFGHLDEIRPWSAQDRIDPTIKTYVELMLSGDPDREVVIELDFWYRSEKERRDGAFETLQNMLREVEGTLLDALTIEEIGYQAALVRVPARIAEQLSKRQGRLADADQIMTIRPQSQYTFDWKNKSAEKHPDISPAPDAISADSCIAALIDGYPISGHRALEGRIDIHECDVISTEVPIASRFHGTAMASLIIHGDLHAGQTLQTKLAVVPVLTSASGGMETTPLNKLPIGVIYRALLTLKQGLNGQPPKGPDVVIINHSICDEYAPFIRRPTPWAALLDYFSHAYGLLFVISAGNIRQSFRVPEYEDAVGLTQADEEERSAAILLALERSKGTRGILSPAESINAITVGALHADGAGPCPPGLIDPFPSIQMTNLCSALGLGINRSLKPELVEHGGRMSAAPSNGTECVSVRGEASQLIGQLVASPDLHTGDTDRYSKSAGTSNAAALVTRTGILAAQKMQEFYKAEGVSWLELPSRAAILKALLCHSAQWGNVGELLHEVFPPQTKNSWHKRRQGIARFLGYGQPSWNRIQNGTENRITLLADDLIQADELHEYRIPLPSAMVGRREVRRIVLTLAWTTPVLSAAASYRGMTLKVVDEDGSQKYWKGVERVLQPNASVLDKGTVFHVVLEGKKLTRSGVSDSRGFFVGVQCRSLHPRFAEENVPYALAVTLEMAQSQRTNLYQEVSQAIRSRAKQSVRATTR